MLAILASFLFLIPEVQAHADLVQASPAPNEVLFEPPDELTIWFTESLESQFAEIQVLDSEGQRVDQGNTAVDPLDRTQVTVGLQPLEPGVYTVAWSNVSSSDGHRVRGTYTFSLGVPLEGDAPISLEQSILQSPWEPVLRWLTYIGMMSVIGGWGFLIVVAGPVLATRASSESRSGLSVKIQRRVTFLMIVGLFLFALASLGHLFIQTAISNDVALGLVIGQPIFTMIGQTYWGKVWLVRMGAALILGFSLVMFRKAIATDHRQIYQWLAITASLIMLLSLSMTSHAAATAKIESAAVFNDFMHILAASIWVGGLFHLVAAFPLIISSLPPANRGSFLSGMVARFSWLGIICVAFLAATGLFSSWAQVTIPAALATPYGRVLISKVVLVIIILGLAGMNLLWVRPRLEQQPEAQLYLARLVRGEAGLALLVLLLTGLLTALEPARQVAYRNGLGQDQAEILLKDVVQGEIIQVAIRPGRIGSNDIIVDLPDHSQTPIDGLREVNIRLSYLGSDLGSRTIMAENDGSGHFVAENVLLNLPGTWQLLVRKYELDAPDTLSAFRFPLNPTAASSDLITPKGDTGHTWLTIELTLIGIVLVGTGGVYFRRRDKWWGITMVIPGIVSLGVVTILVLNLAQNVQPAFPETGELPSAKIELPENANPFLPDMDSVAKGQQVYEAHCLICHGLTGHGDGPRGVGTDAVDIIEHIPLHAAAEYFRIVADHEQRGDLSYSTQSVDVAEVWHLVNYLQVLEGDQAAAERNFSQARSLAEQGQYEQALLHLNQSVELSPRFIQALQGRGILSGELGDLEQARSDFSRVIALDPTYSEGYFERAQVYQATGWWDAARNDLEAYIALVPQAANRSAIEQQIAQIENRIANQSVPPAGNITLQLDDLPSGFTDFPVENFGLIPGSSLTADTVIESSFAFTSQDHFEIIWGFITSVDSDTQKSMFDTQLNPTGLMNLISSGLQAETVTGTGPLMLSENLGDVRTGVTGIFVSAGTQAGVEGVAFRNDNLGAFLFSIYDPENPSTSLEKLALLLARRMNP